jgi:hypothetical protein
VKVICANKYQDLLFSQEKKKERKKERKLRFSLFGLYPYTSLNFLKGIHG